MKKSILIAALGLFSLSTMAQDAKPEEGFVFTTVKENPITSIKNQPFEHLLEFLNSRIR